MQQRRQNEHEADIEEQKNRLEEQRGWTDPGQQPEKQHGGRRVNGGDVFMIDIAPDAAKLAVSQKRQLRVVRSQEVGTEAMVLDGAFPDVAMDVRVGRERQKSGAGSESYQQNEA